MAVESEDTMNLLSVFKKPEPVAAAPDDPKERLRKNKDDCLETVLFKLRSFGQPMLWLGSYGWHCQIEMHVSAIGTSCTIKSEHNHQTPLESARVCADRVVATLDRM